MCFMAETLYVHTSDGLCLILYRERSTRSMLQHWNWIMIIHCVWWPVVVEKSMKVWNSTESMDDDKLRVWSTFGGQKIFWTYTRIKTLDCDKLLVVYFLQRMKKQLKRETALKHWMVINYGVCLIYVEWWETGSMAQSKTWNHCVLSRMKYRRTWNSSQNQNSNCNKRLTIFYLERIKKYMRHATVLEHWVVVNYRKCLTQSDKGTLKPVIAQHQWMVIIYRVCFTWREWRRLKTCHNTEKKCMVISYHINLFWSGLKNTWSISALKHWMGI